MGSPTSTQIYTSDLLLGPGREEVVLKFVRYDAFCLSWCTYIYGWKMTTIPVLSLNVKRLSDPLKCTMVSTSSHKYLPAIFALQETHPTSDTLSCLNLRWVGKMNFSTHTSFSRGASVLIHSSLDYQELECVVNDEGWYVILYCPLFSLKCILAFVYIPPPYNHQVLRVVLEYQLSHPDVPLYVLVDFNCYLEPALDKFPCTAQRNLVDEVGSMINPIYHCPV